MVNIGELTFVNDEAAEVGAIEDSRNDFIKRNDGDFTVTPSETQAEVGTGLQARDGDHTGSGFSSETPSLHTIIGP